ncbi:hypothetical protein B0H13DRAFT_1899720 [Mycena leptocephala]|nr:hypothetical protein B0H13DRAFT_1899720 [Mycena leptocephala]
MFLLICFHGSHPQRYLSPGPELLSMAPCADQEQPAPPSRLEGQCGGPALLSMAPCANQEQPAPPSRLEGRCGGHSLLSIVPCADQEQPEPPSRLDGPHLPPTVNAKALRCFQLFHAPT